MRVKTLALVLACAVTALAGCGSGKLDTESVVGTVTLDGAPLAEAMVNFSPVEAGKGSPSYGKTDEAGRYKLQTMLGEADAGTTPGEYVVTVSKSVLKETGKTYTTSEGETKPEMTSEELLPEKYTNAKTSPLKATVVEGANELNFELSSQ